MVMLTNLAIHRIVVPLQTVIPHLTKVLKKSHRVTYKKKSKNLNEKEGNKRKRQKYCD